MWLIDVGVEVDGWLRAERLGHDLMYDLSSFAQGWIDWNLLVDHKGGPNHLGNVCDAPVFATKNFTDIHLQPKFFYMVSGLPILSLITSLLCYLCVLCRGISQSLSPPGLFELNLRSLGTLTIKRFPLMFTLALNWVRMFCSMNTTG